MFMTNKIVKGWKWHGTYILVEKNTAWQKSVWNENQTQTHRSVNVSRDKSLPAKHDSSGELLDFVKFGPMLLCPTCFVPPRLSSIEQWHLF